MSTFWKDKRVLLTGHTGFKGSWMAIWLQSLGAKVYGFSLAPDTTPSLFNQLGVFESLSHTLGDIQDISALNAQVELCQPDIVFHLAAQPLVRRGYRMAPLTWNTNVMGTVNLLECLRLAKRKCSVVIVTTDKVYQNRETDHHYIESDRLGGLDPYSASKAGTELVVQSYRSVMSQENLPIRLASARAGNVIGGGDWAEDRLVPDIARALSKGLPITVRNPQSVRPWQHVLEPLSGYIQLAEAMSEKNDFDTAFNFGPDPKGNRTVQDVIDASLEHWNGAVREEQSANAPHEAGLLMLSIEQAKSSLGWTPKWDFETTIEKTIEWYKRVQEGASAVEITNQQLREYRDT